MRNMNVAAISLFVLFALPEPVFLLQRKQENCPTFPCGNSHISFPFSKKTENAICGPFVVDGCDKEHPQISLDRGSGKWYRLQNISFEAFYSEGSLSITDTELQNRLNSRDCKSFNDLGLPYIQYVDIQVPNSMTFFKCNRTVAFHNSSFNYEYSECPNFNIFYTDMNRKLPSPPTDCSAISLPANTDNGYSNIFNLLTGEFSLQVTMRPEFIPCYYNCLLNEGKCQRNSIRDQLQCIYTNGTTIDVYADQKESKKDNNTKLKIGIWTGTTAASFVILIIIVYCLKKRLYWKKKTQESESIEAFLKNYGPMAVNRYKYKQVKKMTESFKEKLGQGGYGCVFKGKLFDGRHVAVKILKESKSNGQEFINEVSSISRTSHINIVTLLGFCFEGSKRALIYEFMSNGSLEKHILENNSSTCNREFGWDKLYEITLGIARGLEYLHRGCNTRILHLDIKPHNILLDEDFCPKISDFGLAKICPGRESIISMTGMRGTVGYIAPEIFCRKFGGVSYKSDVYSYGMLVVEMVGARKNICVGVDHKSSEIYFPDWIYKRIELDEEVGLSGIENEEDKQIARKLILVCLWCIQTNPLERPAMSTVVEMLVGSVESLAIPPMPSFSGSPMRLVSN